MFFVLLIIGIAIIVLQIRNSKKEEALSTTVIMIGIELIASSFGSFSDKIVHIISLFKQNVPGSDILEIVKNSGSATNYVQLASGFLLIFLGFVLAKKQHHKKYILNLRSHYDHSIEQFAEDLGLSRFDFKEKIIDFQRVFNKGMNEERARDIIEEIEYQIKEYSGMSKEAEKAYTGIASIPFTIIASSYLGRTKFDEYYEYNKFNKKYYKLKEDFSIFGLSIRKQKYQELKVLTNIDKIDKRANEVVVTVSITSEIKEHQYQQFDCPVVHLSIDNPQDNAITSKQQLYSYCKAVSDTIARISSEFANVKRIHLLYSGQSCLAFDLGTIIEDNRRNKEIVSYQYVTNLNPCYPWGIVINGENKGTLVRCQREGGI